jgi:ribosomal protein S11
VHHSKDEDVTYAAHEDASANKVETITQLIERVKTGVALPSPKAAAANNVLRGCD